MQTSTVIVLACLLAAVVAAQYEHYPAQERVYEAELDTPTHDSSPRSKRGLLLLKKKLLLGALGLKAVKVGAVGAAGVAGALALKGKSGHGHKRPDHTIEVHSKHHQHQHNHVGIPQSFVELHDWSG